MGVAHCAAGQDAASKRLATYTVSTRAYRERTGEAGRARKANAALHIRQAKDPDFVLAEGVLMATKTGVVGQAEACRSQQDRHSVWPLMFSQYGSQSSARTRLLNYSGRRRSLAAYANELVAGGSKDDLVVLVGDAKFNPTFGGKNGSAGPMFKAILELRKLGFTVRGSPSRLSSSSCPTSSHSASPFVIVRVY